MTTKQVPKKDGFLKEGDGQLGEILANQKFYNLRGKLFSLAPFFDEVLKEKESIFFGKNPSQVESKVKELVADLMPLFRKMSQLKRDGNEDLMNEILKALTQDGYLMPGEIYHPDKTVAVTIFMVEPEKSALLFKRHLLFGRSMDDIYKHAAIQVAPEDWQVHENTLRIQKAFPSLEKYLNLKLDEREIFLRKNYLKIGMPLALAYVLDVLTPNYPILRKIENKWTTKIVYPGESYDPNHHFLFEGFLSHGFTDVYKRQVDKTIKWFERCHAPLLFFHFGSPDGVLKNLSRKEQKKIATWTFRVPSYFRSDRSMPIFDFNFGIHFESEHERLKQKWPMFVSKSTSHGLGAMCIPKACGQKEYLYKELKKQYSTHTKSEWNDNARLLFG